MRENDKYVTDDENEVNEVCGYDQPAEKPYVDEADRVQKVVKSKAEGPDGDADNAVDPNAPGFKW